MILGRAMVGPVPLLAIYFLVAAGAVWVILNHTAFGKNIYAIGGNENAARVSGVSVELNLVAVYTIAAFLAAFGGMLMAARTARATLPTATCTNSTPSPQSPWVASATAAALAL
jgi:ABC-type glucose/galactose transport system permease subunit